MTAGRAVADVTARRLVTAADAERYLLRELPSSAADPFTGGRGIERTAALLRALGNPQDRRRVVHVAGTAGKGAVSAFVTGVLVAHGYRVGTYVSPHAYSVFERFLLDGHPAHAAKLGAALTAVRDASGPGRDRGDAPSMFEVSTAAAYQLFDDEAVDYAVVETGLGGLHDATNTVTRRDKLAVITAIGYDHTAVLGTTLREIAAQKAGILPHGGTAVALRGSPEADVAIDREAARRRCTVHRVSGDPDTDPGGPTAGLLGAHQRGNAALAVRVARELLRRDGRELDPRRVAAGLHEVRLPGRFEVRSVCGRTVILDGAHNPMKIAALAATLRAAYPSVRPVWVVAVKQDKDLPSMLRIVARSASGVIATAFGAAVGANADSVPAAELAEAASAAGASNVLAVDGSMAALERALGMASATTPIVVSGSFSLVTELGSSPS